MPAVRRACGAGVLLALAGGRAAAQRESAPATAAASRGVPVDGACRRVESRTNLAEVSGRTIGTLDVVAGAPQTPRVPFLARLAGRTHVRTQQRTLRRFLLIAPRDTVDTLRVAESLRRLRRLGYLDDVLLVANDCGPATPLAVTLLARDAVSLRPDLRFNTGTRPDAGTGTTAAPPQSYSAGFAERNLLGTGRDLSAAAIGTRDRNGFAVAASDPAVLGSLYAVGARLARNPIENATTLSVRPPDRELAELWRGEFAVGSTRRAGAARRGASFSRAGGDALLGRRVAADDGIGSATFLMAGAEAERTRLIAAPNAILGGPSVVRRDFAGVDLGAGRYAEQYGAITWLLPDARVVDVPRGVEGELVAGIGRDQVARRSAAHVDFWSGRMWLPHPDLLGVADVWASGYLQRGSNVSGGSARAALTGVARQPGGYLYGRVAAERLLAPDPDQQALLGFDPTVRIVGRQTRLAQTAVAALVERDWRIASRVGHLNLDLAGFGAASYRASERTLSWPVTPGPVPPPVDQFVSAVGGGVHVVPNAVGRSALRFDYVVPATHVRGGRRNPYVTATVTPWILVNRFRDGRRGF
ncbi:hypothetical protein tb265_29020 [Gemmatimonadetes bacterium T265]|nr:hypothetical protein tb265_29020 [Gemmatimonadetes bacterium T265]